MFSSTKKFFVWLSKNMDIFNGRKTQIASAIRVNNKKWIERYMTKPVKP